MCELVPHHGLIAIIRKQHPALEFVAVVKSEHVDFAIEFEAVGLLVIGQGAIASPSDSASDFG